MKDDDEADDEAPAARCPHLPPSSRRRSVINIPVVSCCFFRVLPLLLLLAPVVVAAGATTQSGRPAMTKMAAATALRRVGGVGRVLAAARQQLGGSPRAAVGHGRTTRRPVAAAALAPPMLTDIRRVDLARGVRGLTAGGGRAVAGLGRPTTVASRPVLSASFHRGLGVGGSMELTTMTPTLTSTKSATVKLFRSLLTKRKYRKKHNATVIEGCRVVRDVLADPRTSRLIRHVLVTEHFLNVADDECGGDLVDMLTTCMAKSAGIEEEGEGENSIPRPRVSVCTESVLSACTDTVTPQGVAALCSIPPPFDPDQILAPAAPPIDGTEDEGIGGGDDGDKEDAHLYLVLDGISDPGNLGTLLRSSVATGVSAVLLLKNTVDPYGPKALRSAAGSTFLLPILEIDGGLDDCLEVLDRCGVPPARFYAATLDAGGGDGAVSSSAHYDVDWVSSATSTSASSSLSGQVAAASALCVGREGPGLSPEIRRAVFGGEIGSLHVPMVSKSTESLNAAVCGSVIMFEFHRQKEMMIRARRGRGEGEVGEDDLVG